jgi:C4-dicarboxylate transporter DctQ subunit
MTGAATARAFARVSEGLGTVERGALAVLFLAAVGALVLDVAARAVFNVAFAWTAEFTRYAIVWMVFLGASVGARRGAHISIDVLAETLPPRAARVAVRAAAFAAAATCLALAVVSAQLVVQMRGFGQTSPSMQAPMWLVYLALPVGCALMTLRFVEFALTARAGAPREAMAASAG